MQAFVMCLVAAAMLGSAPAQAAAFAAADTPGAPALLLSGDIRPNDDAAFRAAAASFKGRVLLTTGPGGAVQAAVAIGTDIRNRGWTTMVPPGATCASACALVWLAGAKRVLGQGARIGFHALSEIRNGTATETHDADMALRHWISGLGYSYDTTNTIVNTSARSIRWFDALELQYNGITVDPAP